MASMGYDMQSAIGASIACLGNIGPGWGEFGPTENYAQNSYYRKMGPYNYDDDWPPRNFYGSSDLFSYLLATVIKYNVITNEEDYRTLI